jgi:hypothetical protein
MAQTNRIIIHHEGGGQPRDSWEGINAKKYSIAIGKTRIEVRRSPNESFITKGTSGRSLQILLTGNRDNYPVTDNDLVLIDQACDVARLRGWIPDPSQRVCQFHGDTMATACPGKKSRERRNDICNVVLGGVAPQPPSPGPEPGKRSLTEVGMIIVFGPNGAALVGPGYWGNLDGEGYNYWANVPGMVVQSVDQRGWDVMHAGATHGQSADDELT